MKTVTTKHDGEFQVTDEQYQLLSWIATIENVWFGKYMPKDQITRKSAYENACSIIGVPFTVIFDITGYGRIKDYRCMNRLSAGDWIFGVNLKD